MYDLPTFTSISASAAAKKPSSSHKHNSTGGAMISFGQMRTSLLFFCPARLSTQADECDVKDVVILITPVGLDDKLDYYFHHHVEE